VFDNKVLRRIFGGKVRVDRMGRICSSHGGNEKCVWDFGVKLRIKEIYSKAKT
jgi:hypothetical protein